MLVVGLGPVCLLFFARLLEHDKNNKEAVRLYLVNIAWSSTP